MSVRLTRINGSPAPDTFVRLLGPEVTGGNRFEIHGRTDAEGKILFEGLPAGDAEVRVEETGFLFARPVAVTLKAAATSRIAIREDSGRPVTVLAVDHAGEPLAGVRLTLSPSGPGRYVMVEGDVQRVGFFTDRSGRFVFPRVRDGAVSVRAKLGTRTTWAEGEAGGTIQVRFDAD